MGIALSCCGHPLNQYVVTVVYKVLSTWNPDATPGPSDSSGWLGSWLLHRFSVRSHGLCALAFDLPWPGQFMGDWVVRNGMGYGMMGCFLDSTELNMPMKNRFNIQEPSQSPSIFSFPLRSSPDMFQDVVKTTNGFLAIADSQLFCTDPGGADLKKPTLVFWNRNNARLKLIILMSVFVKLFDICTWFSTRVAPGLRRNTPKLHCISWTCSGATSSKHISWKLIYLALAALAFPFGFRDCPSPFASRLGFFSFDGSDAGTPGPPDGLRLLWYFFAFLLEWHERNVKCVMLKYGPYPIQ